MPYSSRGSFYSPPKRRGNNLIPLAVLSLAFACAGAKPPFGFKGPPPENAHDRAMARFADRYLDASLRLKPVTASSLGYRKYDRALPEWSAAGSARAAAALHALERELLRIDVNKLSLSYAIDHELIARELAKDLFAIETLQDHTFDVQKWGEAIGGAFYYLTIPPEKTEEWPARLESVLARMAALPRFLEDAKKTLVAPPRIATEFVIGQGPGHVDTFESQLPKLFEPYPALKARFEAEQPKTVKALRDFFAWLESDLSARSTGDYRLGKERFEKKLADTLASEMKAEEIYRAAEGALEATRFEMYDLALPIYAQLFPGDQAFRALAGDERINLVVGRVIEKAALEHGTAESLFDDVRAISAELKKFIREKELIALPPEEDRFVIERTPAFLDGLAVAFYNPAPAFQPDLTKAFWISTVPGSSAEEKESFLREYNRHTLLALVIHEAFPGHYVQAYWSSHSAHASIVKSVLESGTMAEGWAVMIEELLHREGLSASDPKARLFHLKMRLRVFANAMIDVRLHTGGEEEALAAKWAMDLMRRKAFQEEAEAARKLRRAKLTSTQLSTYFVGYREMIGLYESMLAKKVAPRDALAKMISFGTIPPAMIRKMVDMNR